MGRQWLGGPHEGLVGLPGGLGVVGRPSRKVGKPSRRVGRGREASTEGREWSGGHHGRLGSLLGGPGVVERPHGSPGVVGRPSQRIRRPSRRASSSREALLDCQ